MNLLLRDKNQFILNGIESTNTEASFFFFFFNCSWREHRQFSKSHKRKIKNTKETNTPGLLCRKFLFILLLKEQ